MPTTQTKPQRDTLIERPPIVVVMGHIDHGKSTLLDYIRKTNVVSGESGGITQHLSAYEVHHKDKRITFLDTPGHEAFSAMRSRGARVADIAILMVSAEDSVKAQTLEALEAIKEAKIPYIVAINKIDKPNANPAKVKSELVEHGIYLEGFGGDVPYVEISAKQGTRIPELLDMVLLVAELAELKGDPQAPARGVVIESHIDPRKGISATILVTDGTLRKGMCVVSGDAVSPVRYMESFSGQETDAVTFSSPVRITGFNKVPDTGLAVFAYETKKDAETKAKEHAIIGQTKDIIGPENAELVIPVVLKTDVLGTLEAVLKELGKVSHDKVSLQIIHKGAGDITENDIKVASGSPESIIIGFRVRADSKATLPQEKLGITIKTFAIIYNITDYMEEEVLKRAPKEEVEEQVGEAKILRVFGKTKDKQVLGGRVTVGFIKVGGRVKIFRRETEIGSGKILELQQQKIKTTEVKEGSECGAMIESKVEIASGDTIASFITTTK